MRGLGTVINVAAVIIGGGIGLLIKKGINERIQSILLQACGVATIFIGIGGVLSGQLSVGADGRIAAGGTMLLVASLVIGGIAGELIDVEQRLNRIGDRLRSLVGGKNDSRFAEGFVTATLIICVGAMAIVGSVQDGLTGDFSMLFTKSLLDAVIVMVFASALGSGVIFSALPLGLYQGGLTLLAVLASGFLSDALVRDLSMVGSSLIFCIGVNIAFRTKIKTGNLLPSILVPVIYHLFLYLA